MTPFDYVIIAGASCGVCMVLGGMVLLYKGIIKLSEASADEALSIEYKKMLKVQTHYPALALFIIGLAFIISAAWLAIKESPRQFTVEATLNTGGVNPEMINASVEPTWRVPVQIFSGGEIQTSLAPPQPQQTLFELTISLPGHLEKHYPVDPNKSSKGIISLGALDVGSQVADKPAVISGNIVAVPSSLPPVTAEPSFGKGVGQ